MNSVWYQLFWKEFREHFWKMVSLTAVLVAVPLWTMFDEPSSTYFAVTYALMFYTPLAAVFLAMGIAAGERSTGTVAFIGSLPVKMWKLATAKLVMAYAALMVPVVILLLLNQLWRLAWPLIDLTQGNILPNNVGTFPHPVGGNDWCLAILASVALGGGSMLIWAAALGCNFADEVRAAAVALAVIVGWWLVTEVLVQAVADKQLRVLVQDVPTGQQHYVKDLLTAPPGSPGMYPSLLHQIRGATIMSTSVWRIVSATAVLSLAVHSMLAGSFLWRFGRSLPAARPPMKKQLSSASAMLLPAPRRSRLSAIVWKQFRETGPLALIALVSVVGLAWCVSAASYGPLSQGLLFAAAIVGMFVVTATGVGLFESDLQPRLHTFWRSRPIHPGLWFWTKLFTGMALVSVAIYLPLWFGLWADRPSLHRDPSLHGDALAIMPFHALLFTSAVMAICLLRRPVYAAIVSIGGVASIVVLVDEKVSSASWKDACFATLIVLTVTIAWAAVRWNIGVGRSRSR